MQSSFDAQPTYVVSLAVRVFSNRGLMIVGVVAFFFVSLAFGVCSNRGTICFCNVPFFSPERFVVVFLAVYCAVAVTVCLLCVVVVVSFSPT